MMTSKKVEILRGLFLRPGAADGRRSRRNKWHQFNSVYYILIRRVKNWGQTVWGPMADPNDQLKSTYCGFGNDSKDRKLIGTNFEKMISSQLLIWSYDSNRRIANWSVCSALWMHFHANFDIGPYILCLFNRVNYAQILVWNDSLKQLRPKEKQVTKIKKGSPHPYKNPLYEERIRRLFYSQHSNKRNETSIRCPKSHEIT